MISTEFDWRGEFQIVESLMMCSQDRAVKLDRDEAYTCGKKAVELALAGEHGVMVTIQRKKGKVYKAEYGTIPLGEVANHDKTRSHERPLPDNFISKDGMDVTPACIAYMKPLVGELPETAALTIKRAK